MRESRTRDGAHEVRAVARAGASGGAHVAAVVVVEFGGRERGAAHTGLRGRHLRATREPTAAGRRRARSRLLHAHAVHEAARAGATRGPRRPADAVAAAIACW